MFLKSKETRTSTDDMAFFMHLASAGSLTVAAREMGLSLPAVSKRLRLLEERLGVQLLHRTTRRIELTPEGKSYLEGARPLLDQLLELEDRISSQNPLLRGSLNINASFGFGRRFVAPCLSRFAALHPQMNITLQLTSQPLNFLDAQMDIDIRVGEPPDARLVARKLRDNPRVLCCSPGYAAQHGLPASVNDLAKHSCILLKQFDSDFTLWRMSRGKQTISQKVHGHLVTNDGEVAMRMAIDGHGILLRSWWDAEPSIANGELIHVLPEWQATGGNIYAVWLPQRTPHNRITAFVDYLAAQLHGSGE